MTAGLTVCARSCGRWQWSGAFALNAREDYFGLRVRHSQDPERAINIPVNITVGPTGAQPAVKLAIVVRYRVGCMFTVQQWARAAFTAGEFGKVRRSWSRYACRDADYSHARALQAQSW